MQTLMVNFDSILHYSFHLPPELDRARNVCLPQPFVIQTGQGPADVFSSTVPLGPEFEFRTKKMEEQVELEEDFDENYEPSAQGTTRV